MCLNEMLPGFDAEEGAIAAIQGSDILGMELSKEQPKPVPPFDCAAFSMMFFKVLPCQKKYNHDWTACPGSHPNEKARRRCLLLYRYGAKVCPDMQTRGVCPRGESCYMTHGMFEYYMHPLKYKTKMCKSGSNCRRHYCFFSHTPEELRDSTSIPDNWQLQMLPDGTIISSSIPAVLASLPLEAHSAAQAAIAQLPQVVQAHEGPRGLAQHQHPQQLVVGLPQGYQGGPMGWQWGPGTYAAGMAAGGPQEALSYGSACGLPSGAHTLDDMVQLQQSHQAQPQQPHELLQYNDSVLSSSSQVPLSGLVLLPQHNSSLGFQPVGSIGSGQQVGLEGILPLQQQQQGVVVTPTANVAVVSGPAGSPAVLQGSGSVPPMGLQSMSSASNSAWAGAPAAAQQLHYGIQSTSSASLATPTLLQAPGNMVLRGQGGTVFQGGCQVQPGSRLPHQAYYQLHDPALQQQQQPQGPSSSSSFMAAAQPVSAGVPLSQAVLLRMHQVQPQQQLMAAGVSPQAGGSVGVAAQQPGGVGPGQLVSQLQALSLTNMNLTPQLQ